VVREDDGDIGKINGNLPASLSGDLEAVLDCLALGEDGEVPKGEVKDDHVGFLWLIERP
jgi:hypothetical protein